MPPNIPPGSWGGDFDPQPQFYCPKCGAATPFQGLCEQHAKEAEAEMRARHAAQLQKAQSEQQAPVQNAGPVAQVFNQPVPTPASHSVPTLPTARLSANISQQLVTDSVQRLQRLRTSVERGGLDGPSMMYLLEVMTELQFAIIERMK